MKKIVHIIYRLDVGGLESVLVALINRLPCEQYEHTVICLTSYTSFKDRIRNPQVRLVAMNKRPGKDLLLFFRLLALLVKLRPDVVHTYNIATLEYQAAALLAGARLRVHAEHGRDFSDLKGENRKYNALRKLMNPLLHYWVPVSQDLAQWLHRKVGISEKKIRLIYNGVDTASFAPASPPVQEETGSSMRIITVGRLDPVKDQATLVHAFRILCKRISSVEGCSVQLWIVGAGPEREALQGIIEQEGLEDRVLLLGERHDIAELLRQSDIFVLSSLAEGIPMTILEAAATGLPVVATDVGGIAEIVRDGETGYLVSSGSLQELADAIWRYWEQPHLRLAHGRAGCRRIADKFSLDAMARQYAQLYEQEPNGK
ncbi:MAG: TIGR03088 family PEP-CTERM/XrtA system glycosyltransferase [Desulfobulbus sp.]|jgi:sugar transferase (PEP-CTERM/EpsH1 system associated)